MSKDVPLGRLPPGQKLAKGWPVLHYGPVPPSDLNVWDFRVWGAVERPTTLSYRELRSLPTVRVKADFHCVTKFSVLDNEWEGVSFETVARLVQPTGSARFVMAHCEYGYEANLPLEALLEGDALFAWGHNGKPLTPEHGSPLRLVVPRRYAWKSAKWVRGIEFMVEDRLGFWERRGYHNLADPWREERYASEWHAEPARRFRRRQR